MPRIRSIHPPIFTDENWVSCSPMARHLLIGIWVHADDQGVFEWKPVSLKMRVFPADHVDVAALLQELADHNWIRRFPHDGKEFGAVRNFRKWQRPKKPNAVHFLPPEFSSYVGLIPSGSEPAVDQDGVVGDEWGTGGEISDQREDEGGRGRREASSHEGETQTGPTVTVIKGGKR